MHNSKTRTFPKKAISALLLASTLSLSGCGYNTLQAQDEQINAGWSEVVNQYQRRADLVPNLVAVVQRYAEHEQAVFTEVAEARAKVGSVQITPEVLNDPNALAQYQEAQGQMTSALSRLMAVSERYPEIKADAMFQDLQAQLEGAENRISEARRQYIGHVQAYNTTVRQFPTNLTAKVFGMDVKPNFTVDNEKAISTAPSVSFNTTAPTNNAATGAQVTTPITQSSATATDNSAVATAQ